MPDVAGRYPVNKTHGDSAYPDTVEYVYVFPPEDGYCDIVLFDEDGMIVLANNRALFRIEGALEGEYGYDVFVEER